MKNLMACYVCNESGHWARDCPSRSPIISVKGPSSVDDGETPVVYCPCDAGPCIVRTSHTEKNPNRRFFWCPKRGYNDKEACDFFKWCDEVRSPQCPCGAGACSIQTETSGINKGRQYFACRIKKGQGACSFFQWVDSHVNLVTSSNRDNNSHNRSSAISTSYQVANAVSDSNKSSFAASGSKAANTASESCNGNALHIRYPTVTDRDQSSILNHAIPGDPLEIVDTSNIAKEDSSNIQPQHSIWGSQPTSVSDIHHLTAKIPNQNFDVRTCSVEVQSHLPRAGSCSIRSLSSDNFSYPQPLESDTSRSPENLGQRFSGCKNHPHSNYGHFPWTEEINTSMLMRIEQLKREKSELESTMEDLRKQVTAYVEKEKMLEIETKRYAAKEKMLEIEIKRYEAKESVYKPGLLWCFAVMLAVCLTSYSHQCG